jgi:hypothetical protein
VGGGRASRFIIYIRRIAPIAHAQLAAAAGTIATALVEHKERGTSRPSNRALLKLQFVVEGRTSRWRESASGEKNQPVKRRTSR